MGVAMECLSSLRAETVYLRRLSEYPPMSLQDDREVSDGDNDAQRVEYSSVQEQPGTMIATRSIRIRYGQSTALRTSTVEY